VPDIYKSKVFLIIQKTNVKLQMARINPESYSSSYLKSQYKFPIFLARPTSKSPDPFSHDNILLIPAYYGQIVVRKDLVVRAVSYQWSVNVG